MSDVPNFEGPRPRPTPGDEVPEPFVIPDVDGGNLLDEVPGQAEGFRRPNLSGLNAGVRTRAPRLVKKTSDGKVVPTPEQRLLLLDTWRRSGLPAGDFAPLVGLSPHTLYDWKKRFDLAGPAGLLGRQGGRKGESRLPEVTKRTILMLKEDNPDWGCQRISDVLARHPGLGASPGAISRVLHEAGYELEEGPSAPHPDHVRFFERAKPNQLWQTDLFTFILKRQNRRVHLVVFMDDHSRFIVGYGLHATASATLVIEVFRAAIASYQAPAEVLTDNGTQYVTWRGTSAFAKECQMRGMKHIVAKPRHPQTLGKCERFWGSLWRECVGAAVFVDLEDARKRIGHFIDHYNFQRPHQGIGGLVPADRFFGAAEEILKTLKARVAANALALSQHGIPKPPLYLTGTMGESPFSVHQEGEKLILNKEGERIELAGPVKAAEMPDPVCPQAAPESVGPEDGSEEPPEPGISPIDGLGGDA